MSDGQTVEEEKGCQNKNFDKLVLRVLFRQLALKFNHVSLVKLKKSPVGLGSFVESTALEQ